jgi:hypothetical protein
MTPPVEGLLGSVFVPLFTGYLTAAAGRTFGCIDEKGFIGHWLSPPLRFLRLFGWLPG